MAIIKSKDVVEVNQITKDLKKVRDEIDALTQSNKKLSESLQNVKKANDGTEAKKLADGIDKLTKSNKGLTEIQKQELKLQKQLITSEAKLVASYDAEAQQLAEVKLEQQERNKQLKQAAQANKVATNSLKGMRVELSKLTDKYDKLSKKERENIKVGGRLQSQINKTSKALKNAENATDRNQRSVGKYSDALKGLGKQLLGALGITAGLSLLVDQFKKASERIGTLNKLTRQLEGTFDVTTKEAKKLASQINAMAQNFEDVDAKSLQTSLTAVAKIFTDLSEQEALDLIQEGFQKGSNNSGEFLDILKEYPVFFKKAGLTASEMFAVINQQVKAGVYSDKGVDAIKESNIQLTENTKIVRDALRPLGESVNLQIRQFVEAGKSFKATQLISKEMIKLGVNSSEAQTIMADVFKGAGEDSDNFVRNLHNVSLSLDDVANQTSIVEEANLGLSTSYNNFLQSVSDGTGTISTSISETTLWFSELFDTLSAINEVDFANKLKIAANSVVEFIDLISLGSVSQVADGFKNLGLDVNGFKFNIDQATEAMKLQHKEQTNSVRLTKEQKEATEEETKEVVELTEAQIKLIEQRKQDQITILERQEDLVDAVENEIELVKSIGEIKAETEQETQDNLNSIIQDGSDRRKQINDEETANFIKNGLIVQEATAVAGEQIGDLMAQGLLTFKSFGKILLATTLDLVQRQVNIYLAGLLAREVFSKGPAGLITFGVLSIAINAALGAAKSAVSSFEDGGEIGGNRHSQGGTIIEAEKGEFVVNRGGYSDAPDIINAVNDGLLTDMNASQVLSKQDNNMLLAGLLTNMNDTNKQILQAALNGGVFYTNNGQGYLRGGDGETKNFIP